MNDADLWFEQSLYCLQNEVENIDGICNRTSQQYRAAQRLQLEIVRAAIDKLVSEWKPDAP